MPQKRENFFVIFQYMILGSCCTPFFKDEPFLLEGLKSFNVLRFFSQSAQGGEYAKGLFAFIKRGEK